MKSILKQKVYCFFIVSNNGFHLGFKRFCCLHGLRSLNEPQNTNVQLSVGPIQG